MPSREGRRDAEGWQASDGRPRERPVVIAATDAERAPSGAPASARGGAGRPTGGPPSPHRPPDELLAIAVRAATLAAEILEARSSSVGTLRWDEKARSDFVTDVDRASEACVTAVVRDLAPEARLLGEEFTPDLAGNAPLATVPGTIFVTDPLDGTTNYLHGYPEYAVSIGVIVDGVLTAGVVRNAVTGDTYTAVRGGGSFRNGTRLSVSTVTDPARALVGTGFPFSHTRWLAAYQAQFAAVSSQVAGIRRAGSAALDLAAVASGRFDAFWELMLAPWDIAAGILLIREAGGLVTDLSGDDAPVGHTPVIAGNPVMHAWLRDTIREAGRARSSAGPD